MIQDLRNGPISWLNKQETNDLSFFLFQSYPVPPPQKSLLIPNFVPSPTIIDIVSA